MPFAYDQKSAVPSPKAGSRSGPYAPRNPLWSQMATGSPPAPAKDPEVAAKEEAEAEVARQAFEKAAPYEAKNFRPPTGSGLFDATYANGVLSVVVRCSFRFNDRTVGEFAYLNRKVDKSEVEWDQKGGETERWRKQFLADVSGYWNAKPIWLYSRRPHWEGTSARVDVKIVAIEPGAPNLHYRVSVDKKPNEVPSVGVTRGPNRYRPFGTMEIDNQSLKADRNSGGNYQRVGIHESVHVFGLGDTYEDKADPSAAIRPAATPSHGFLVEQELGSREVRKDDNRITSVGEKLGLAEGVTFLTAIRAATKMPDWSLQPGIPKRKPREWGEAPPIPANLA